MKKMRRFLTALVAMVLVMATPAMAGEWVWPYAGESPIGRPTHYIKDDGTYAINEYLTIDGKLHYFDYTGAILIGNYSPSRRWFNEYGVLDSNLSWPEPFADIKEGTYRWTNDYEQNDGVRKKIDVVISDIAYSPEEPDADYCYYDEEHDTYYYSDYHNRNNNDYYLYYDEEHGNPTITGKVKFVYSDMEYNLIEADNGTYMLTDTDDKYILGYITYTEPYRTNGVIKISIDGLTKSYYRIK